MRTAARRRQRSTRLVVAVVLLGLSALVVAWALLDGAAWLQGLAAVVALVLGAAATRITHSELAQTRRDAATDRAQQAQEYARITERRTAENVAFAADMKRRITDRESAITELEEALATAQEKLASTTRKMSSEARRADVAERELADQARLIELSEERAADAIVRVAELESELEVMRVELESWKAAARHGRASA